MNALTFPADRPYDMIALGRIAVDFNPVDYYMPLAESTTFRKYVGGSPANIATGLARLGKKVGFFARIADDGLGDFVEGFFRREGIDTSHVLRCQGGEKLGLAFTEILDESHSSILMYRNQAADLTLSPDDIDQDYLRQAKTLLVSGTALAQSPSREAALKAVLLAKKNDVKVIFDIDYRGYNWAGPQEVAVYYSLVAERSDIIMGSREEFDLTQGPFHPGLDDRATADLWLGKGCSIVIIKHGKEGSTAYTGDGQAFRVKPFPVKLLKAFGGGDGYASAFLCGLLEGLPINRCLTMGSASAAMLVASPACSVDMPTRPQLEEFLARHADNAAEEVRP